MHDPLQHGSRDPGRHDGPFVESRGLFGGLLRRRSSEQPQQPPARQPMTPPRPAAFDDDPPGGGVSTSALPWWLRNIRVLVVIGVLVYGAGSSLLGEIGVTPDRARPAPAPSPLQTQGRYDLEVVRLQGEWVTLRDADGETYRWEVTKPAVRKVLVRHTGKSAIMYWRLENGITHVVGIVGPLGTVPPYAEEETSSPQAST